MVRLGAVFVAVCMAVIAGAFGAAVYLVLGLGAMESAIVAIAALTGFGLYSTVSMHLKDRGVVGGQIADLSRGTADLARQVGELGRRVAALEGARGREADKALAATAPMAAEIEELGALIRELAQSVAVHDAVLAGAGAMTPPTMNGSAAGPAKAEIAAPAERSGTAVPEGEIRRHASGRFKDMEHDSIVALIRRAVEGSRVELYLQPIVTLPQRKARYYEAVSRLRMDDGDLLQPDDFLPYAERGGGLISQIDNLMLLRCVQVVRRLQAKNREIGLFCNISAATLVDPQFYPQFTEFMEANRAIAPSLILEFTQATYRNFGPIETESLAGLADQGFRFSLDHVTDLRLEPRDLAERGFRFLKVPAALLLGRGLAPADIHPADFAGLVSRFGIELIAERIESEAAVVDLLDYDVKYGQGFLFSPPRAVRPEVMQGIAERTDVVAREAPAAGEAPRPGSPGASPPASPPTSPVPGEGERTAAAQRRSLAQLARGVAARR
ncbi:MAG TPA: EAL domain-containing protein [Xanthobacteraceae bacterium]|nr:EAL domain-containing protein [Xanthobacteraceae bacterium]